MPSAWGQSWGQSWGLNLVPVIIVGGDDAWAESPRYRAKSIRGIVDRGIDAVYAELMASKKPGIARKAKKVVKPHMQSGEIQWGSVLADNIAYIRLIRLYLQIYTEQQNANLNTDIAAINEIERLINARRAAAIAAISIIETSDLYANLRLRM